MYTYSKVNHFYLNVGIPRLHMAYLLMHKLKPLRIVDGDTERPSIASYLAKLYRAIRLLSSVHYTAKQQGVQLTLPASGQIVLFNKRRQCYKAFDPINRKVTTVYKDDPGEQLEKELSYFMKAGEAGLAPKLLYSGVREGMRVYEEQYLNQEHIQEQFASEQEASDILSLITQFLNQMDKTFTPRTINRHQYLSNKVIFSPQKSGNYDIISDKLEAIVAALKDWKETLAEENASLRLSLSHGDFRPGNLLRCSDRLFAIDWEFADWRSSSYDFCFFYYKTFKRMPIEADSTDRRLFYFEYIHHWYSVMSKQCSHYSEEDLHHLADWILRDVDMFRSFERNDNRLAKLTEQEVHIH